MLKTSYTFILIFKHFIFTVNILEEKKYKNTLSIWHGMPNIQV